MFSHGSEALKSFRPSLRQTVVMYSPGKGSGKFQESASGNMEAWKLVWPVRQQVTTLCLLLGGNLKEMRNGTSSVVVKNGLVVHPKVIMRAGGPGKMKYWE